MTFCLRYINRTAEQFCQRQTQEKERVIMVRAISELKCERNELAVKLALLETAIDKEVAREAERNRHDKIFVVGDITQDVFVPRMGLPIEHRLDVVKIAGKSDQYYLPLFCNQQLNSMGHQAGDRMLKRKQGRHIFESKAEALAFVRAECIRLTDNMDRNLAAAEKLFG
jgi:hypothetical protein